jgi:iron complex outermembrane receptor protein
MKKIALSLGIGICAVFALGHRVDAQPLPQEVLTSSLTEISLEALMNVEVVSASKKPQKLSEAPASITVITAEEIKQYGWQTLADLLRSVRGFYVSNDRNYSYLGVRGFSKPADYNSRILIQLNGHTLNDDIWQAFLVGRESGIDLDLIERVEIVRGPSSALYGTSAFLAIVNVITKSGSDMEGMRTFLEVGSENTNKGLFTFGKRYENGLNVLLSSSYLKSDGQEALYFSEFDDGKPTHNGGVAENADEEFVYAFSGSLRYRDSSLDGLFYERGKAIPTGSYGSVFNDGRAETFDKKYFVEFKHHPKLREGLSLLFRLYDDQYRYTARFPLNYPPIILNHDNTLGRWYGMELQTHWTAAPWSHLLIGTEAQNHKVHLRNFDEAPSVSYVNREEQFQLYSAYIEEEIRLRENLIATGGARLDVYKNYIREGDHQITPRAAFVYQPHEGRTIKALYGQAFRVPNSYELFFCGTGYNFVCNPNLRPETNDSYEISYDQAFRSYLTGSLSIFRYDVKDLIVLNSIGSGKRMFENLKQARGTGIETGLRGQWASGATSYSHYTYQVVEDRKTQEIFFNSPRHLAGAGGTVPLFNKKGSLGIEEQYVSRRKTVREGETIKAYFITNLTLTRHNLYKNTDLSSSIYNVFDTQYADPGFEAHIPLLRIPQDGRRFNVKIIGHF